ncbi:hypothetical protein [Bradyrhizobium sp. LMTR 3]|uniref:hypothetical protein n=1 Tax=Bradyrhizobium sp. LMTR 3 TaxID=189873 RepID=UPI00159F3179|nr:hypothetical protein [Bradyrhizobium sp. LMTR 3]
MTVEVFDAHFLIPFTLRDAGNAYGIIAVALVDLHFQSNLGGSGAIQMTGSPSLFNSVHSHVDVAPVSSPIRATYGAFDLMNAAIASGSERTMPSRNLSRQINNADRVSFRETSSPT